MVAVLTVVVDPSICKFPETVKLPVTVTASSIVVVPPAESMVRLPDAVSISLSPVTPICTLSIEAPPLASRAPVMVTPASNVAASATVNPSRVVAPSTSNVPDTVSLPVTARTVPLNVRLPLSSSSPEEPASTTLPDVRSAIAAVSAARLSIFAVPSKCRSWNSSDEVPKSTAPSDAGTISALNLPVGVMVSPVASPSAMLPFIVVVPVTVRFPETVALSSIATVPPAESRVRLPEAVSISLSPVTPICTLSILAPPLASIAPVNVEAPVIVVTPDILTLSKSVCPSTSKATPTARVVPLNVRLASSSNSPDVPAMTTLLSVRSAIAAVSAARVSMFAVPSRCRSWNSSVDDPKSTEPSADGTISVSTLPTKLIVSLVASPRSTVPFNTELPVTVRLSSTVTVPPAESIVRLPEAVSISLSPVTPI